MPSGRASAAINDALTGMLGVDIGSIIKLRAEPPSFVQSPFGDERLHWWRHTTFPSPVRTLDMVNLSAGAPKHLGSGKETRPLFRSMFAVSR